MVAVVTVGAPSRIHHARWSLYPSLASRRARRCREQHFEGARSRGAPAERLSRMVAAVAIVGMGSHGEKRTSATAMS
nr:unnamed protein product [Digitaria exilis]